MQVPPFGPNSSMVDHQFLSPKDTEHALVSTVLSRVFHLSLMFETEGKSLQVSFKKEHPFIPFDPPQNKTTIAQTNYLKITTGKIQCVKMSHCNPSNDDDRMLAKHLHLHASLNMLYVSWVSSSL